MPGRAVRAPLGVAAAALAALMAASVVAPAGPPPARGAPAEQRTAEQRTTRLQAQGTDPAGLPGPARRPAGRLPHGNDVPPPGVSLFHRPSLEELRERTTLRSPSPRLRGLAALGQATTAPPAQRGRPRCPASATAPPATGSRWSTRAARWRRTATTSCCRTSASGRRRSTRPCGSAPGRPAAAAT